MDRTYNVKEILLDICWKRVRKMKAITGIGFEPDICRLKFRKISTLWTAGFWNVCFCCWKWRAFNLTSASSHFIRTATSQETPLLGLIVHPS